MIVTRRRPFAISTKRATKSPFKTVSAIRECLNRWRHGDRSIGFTRIASLKAMGLIPRSNGLYQISPKYQDRVMKSKIHGDATHIWKK